MPHVALVPLQSASPERRVTQKEIIAGEERPKYLAVKHLQETGQGKKVYKNRNSILLCFYLFIFIIHN